MMYHIRLFLITAATLATVLAVRPAISQNATGPPCGDRAHVVDALRKDFGEHLVARGLSATGWLIEVYAAVTGAWSIVATTPTGTSCIVTWGEAWEGVRPPDREA